MADDNDAPPPLEEVEETSTATQEAAAAAVPVRRTKDVLTGEAAVAPGSALNILGPAPARNAAAPAAAAPVEAATAATADAEVETLQDQMMRAALAKNPEASKEKSEQERKQASGAFKGGALKKGFLLGGSSSSSSSSSASASKPKAAAASTALVPTAKSTTPSSSGAANTSSGSGPALPFLQAKPAPAVGTLTEVQEALRGTMADRSWMTPDLLQRIAADPRMVAGMSNPRFMAALTEAQKDADGVLKKHAGDSGLQDFLRTFMGIMGEHFHKLGEAQAAEEAKKSKVSAATSSGSSGSSGGAGAGAGAGAKSTSSELVPTATRSLKGDKGAQQQQPAPWPATGILSPQGPPSDEVVRAAREGKLPAADAEVRQVLSNRELVDVLRDPDMQRIMEEVRVHPERLGKYLANPAIRRKFAVMQQAGLIRFE